MIVVKFGGTSVEDAPAILRAAEIVRSRVRQQPVVVVSALARVTDQLIAMGRAAAEGRVTEAIRLFGIVRDRHHRVAADLVPEPALKQLAAELDRLFPAVRALVLKVAAAGSLHPKIADEILGYGELLSSRIVAHAFATVGLNAVLVDARECILTDAAHTNAAPLVPESYVRLGAKLLPLVRDGFVPVLGGFIGSTPDGVPTTLGRGGSDFTAALVAGGIGARRIEIWTDVDGIMTADPRICPDACTIPALSYDEATELAHYGAKVLHPGTVWPATNKNIPVHILNSRKPDGAGTRVNGVVRAGSVKAITVKTGVALLEVLAAEGRDASLLHTVLEVLDDSLVDLVRASRAGVSVLVNSVKQLPALENRLKNGEILRCQERRAIVCLVGHKVGNDSNVAARALGVLPDVEVALISPASPGVSLSFVVDEERAHEVVRLHRVFFVAAAPLVAHLEPAGGIAFGQETV